MSTPTPDLLLLEVEEIIRSMPSQRDFVANPQKCLPWLGRASAAMNAWDSIRSIAHFEPLVQQYSRASAQSGNLHFGPTHQSLLVLLHQAQSDLRLKTTGPLSVGVPSGRVFEYFDEVRKLIESAKADLLFVDGLAGYQSGASFKDGAKKAPTTLTQITDAFSVVLATYEQLWAQATPV